jgi:hypothetical protein
VTHPTVGGPVSSTPRRRPAHQHPFALDHCLVRDPDGHVVEIQRFDEPL